MAPSGSPPPDVPALHARVAPVLGALGFPARRWQVLAEADLYGVDSVTRSLLTALPELTYPSFADLLHVLAAVMHGASLPSGLPPRAVRSGNGTAARPGSLESVGSMRRGPDRAPGSPSPTP